MLRSVGLAILFTLPTTVLAVLVRAGWEPLLGADGAAVDAATAFSRAHPDLVRALLVWEELFQPRWVYLVGTLVCGWVWWRHRWPARAAWGFVTMMIAWNLALDAKLVVARDRPVVADPVSVAPGYSFPSGHAANTATCATAVVVLLWPALTRRGRTWAIASAVLLTLATAADRVFLGVHFPTDVLAGMVFGTGLVLASYAGWRPASATTPRR